MIALTRLNNSSFVVNAELIRYIESTPDTLITLDGGEKIMVRESLDEVVNKAVDYARQIHAFSL